MDALINIVLPVFGIILTGYLAGRFEALRPESAAARNRFVFYFALPCALPDWVDPKIGRPKLRPMDR
jgi:malonate transporter and related proteins